MSYQELSKEALTAKYQALLARYERYCEQGLKLDMSRGKPGPEQLDLSQAMLAELATPADCKSRDGLDCRNYGVLDGIPEAKELFAALMDVPTKNLLVAGNSSLNLMYDTVARNMLFGTTGSPRPWGKEENNLLLHYQALGEIRSKNSVYKKGDFKLIHLDESLLVFSRGSGAYRYITVVNNGADEISLSFDAKTKELISDTSAQKHIVEANTAKIFKVKKQ